MKINMQNTFYFAVGMCCCLKICNSVVNIVVMGLVATWVKFHGHI